MTISDVFLLLASTVGLIWSVRTVLQQNRFSARKRLDDNGERWGIRKKQLFGDAEDDEDDETFWE